MDKILIPVSLVVSCFLHSLPACADQFASAGDSGDYARRSHFTGTQGVNNPPQNPTNTNTSTMLPTWTTQLGGIFGPPTRNGLPPTMMDSFVYESGYSFLIYGDEGTDSYPPLFGFEKDDRINAGIFGIDAVGLSTGHSSYLPDAWGRDEFLGGEEWDQSGNGVAYVPPYGGSLNFDGGGQKPIEITGSNSGCGAPNAIQDYYATGGTGNANAFAGFDMGGAGAGLGNGVGVNVGVGFGNGVGVNVGAGFGNGVGVGVNVGAGAGAGF